MPDVRKMSQQNPFYHCLPFILLYKRSVFLYCEVTFCQPKSHVSFLVAFLYWQFLTTVIVILCNHVTFFLQTFQQPDLIARAKDLKVLFCYIHLSSFFSESDHHTF